MKTFFRLAMGILAVVAVIALVLTSAPDGECGRLCDMEFWKSATLTDVQVELAKDSDLQVRDEDGHTPLHYAAGLNANPGVVTALLKARAALEARDKDGWTPLHIAAAENENPGVVTVLLKAGAKIEARDKDGHTPLHIAAKYGGNPEVVTMLLKAGAPLEAQEDKYGGTPLHWAGLNANPAVVMALLKAGAKIEARDYIGSTPLHWAAADNENPAVVTALLEARAKVMIRTPEEFVEHAISVGKANDEIIRGLHRGKQHPKLLWTDQQIQPHIDRLTQQAVTSEQEGTPVVTALTAGAALEARNRDGRTPLHGAAWHNENPAVVTVLLKAGAKIEARDKDGRTPLHGAAWHNENPAVVIALLDTGADPKAKTASDQQSIWDTIHNLLDSQAKTADSKTAFELIQENDKLKDTDAYWRLHDLQYE